LSGHIPLQELPGLARAFIGRNYPVAPVTSRRVSLPQPHLQAITACAPMAQRDKLYNNPNPITTPYSKLFSVVNILLSHKTPIQYMGKNIPAKDV